MNANERQLERVLSSEVFAGGKRYRPVTMLATLLRYLATETLAGHEITDSIILIDFYKFHTDRVKEKHSHARINVSRLRERLEIYNDSLGVDDPITLTIPLNQYHVLFSENRNSPAQKEVRRGLFYVLRESPDNIRQALIHFGNAVSLDSAFSEGYAGKANALLTMTLHALSDNQNVRLDEALQMATKAVALNANSWRGHACIGAVSMLRHDGIQAEESFNRARSISPREIDMIDSYGPYLLSRGKYEEALIVAQRYRHESDNPVLLRRAGIYLYALRDFDEAREILEETLKMEKGFWLSHVFLALVFLAQESSQDAMTQMEHLEKSATSSPWPGLKIMCLCAAEKWEQAESMFHELLASTASNTVPSIQLVFANIALGNHPEAIMHLIHACDENEPFTVCLQLWAFLDPLRRYPDFQKLLRKTGLPAK